MSKGWRKIRLGNEIELRTGYPFQSSGYTDDDNDIKLLRGDNIVQGTLRWENAKRWPKAEISNYEEFLLNEGDVILAMDRPWIDAGLKFSKISTADLPCLQVQRTARLRGGKNLSTAYLKYIIASDSFAKYVQLINTGSNVPHISSQQIKDFPVSVPTIEEQEKIAKILSDLDSKIELNNKINAELEAMSKTIYDYWFVQFDFPNVKGKPYKSSGGKMVWNEELKREIPEGWDSLTLDKIGDITGGSTPSREVEAYFTQNGIPWITPKDLSMNSGNKFIKKGEIDVSEEGKNAASLNLMPNGTVLMSSRAPVGYLAIARNVVTTNQGFKSFVPKSYFSTEYIYYTVMNLMPVIENNASGSTFKEVSGSVLKTIYALAPKKEIVELFTLNVKPIFNRQEIIEEENQQLASLRDWLLPMLMNGQVKVKN